MSKLKPAFDTFKLNQQIAQIEFNNLNTLGNATADDLAIGCLHSVGGYWVSNEGTKIHPNFHVWEPGITHSTCDSAYGDLSLAIARCNYLAKNRSTKY